MNEDPSLRQVISYYQRYVSVGYINGYMSLFKDDVVWMPPNAQDRFGKAEVFKAEAGAFDKFNFRFEMAPTEVRRFSDMWTMVLCSSQGVMTPRGGGDGIEFRYRVLFLIEKQPDGRWLIARQIWNQKSGESVPKSGGPW